MVSFNKVRDAARNGDVRAAVENLVGKVLPDDTAKKVTNTILGKENNSPEAKDNAKLKAQIAAQKEQNRLAQEKLDLEAELAAERKKAEDLKANTDAQAAAERAELERELKEQEDLATELAAKQAAADAAKAKQDAADAAKANQDTSTEDNQDTSTQAKQDAADAAKANQDASTEAELNASTETSENSANECALLPVDGICAEGLTLSLNGCCLALDTHSDL